MRIVMFAHSLVSDWNHGNAHFLRGIVRDLQRRGHQVDVLEPREAWSRSHLVATQGEEALRRFGEAYPDLQSRLYDPRRFALDATLRGADLVLVHEWNDPRLVRRIGEHHRATANYDLLFHDTHHRSLTRPKEMARYDLRHYDGVLAFGEPVRQKYIEHGWAERAWTWHEAADDTVFHPAPDAAKEGDLVWIGNWGDEERTRELREFLVQPVRRLGLRATVHGVRYPRRGRRILRRAGIRFAGWLPNFDVPRAFARHRVTVHIPRRPYVDALPGIPTIRMFEALACGIPLVTSPWFDTERLFRPGRDHLVAYDGGEMADHLRALLEDASQARRLAEEGRKRILERHTCRHRVDELLAILKSRRAGSRARGPSVAFFGSSLVSSYWNGAATYYRGIIRALAARGCRVTFYEPDARGRQRRRDIPDPPWCRVVVYPARGEEGVLRALEAARGSDVVVKASGVGVHDELLEERVLRLRSAATRVLFWDVDAPATLDRIMDPGDPFRPLVPQYDAVLTYGGGQPVVKAYESLGAKRCVPIYNALDPATHHPASPDRRFQADLAFLGNRLPDREARVEEFLLRAASLAPRRRFLLAGSGWEGKPLPSNVHRLDHVPTADHNAFNSTPLAILNVNRESMARYGFSPATRVFEAAGAGACIITDAFAGVESFLEPGREILVARSAEDVTGLLEGLTPARARAIGMRARARVLAEHTYERRAEQVMRLLEDLLGVEVPA